MQLSLNIKPELYQQMETSASLRGKSIDNFVVDEIQSLCEDEQRAIKELDDFLKPTIIAANNGHVSDKTPDEIFKEVMESVSENQR